MSKFVIANLPKINFPFISPTHYSHLSILELKKPKISLPLLPGLRENGEREREKTTRTNKTNKSFLFFMHLKKSKGDCHNHTVIVLFLFYVNQCR